MNARRMLAAGMAAICCAACTANADGPVSVTIYDSKTDPTAIKVQPCEKGMALTFHAPNGTVDKAERGSLVKVTGTDGNRYDGLYRVISYSHMRDQSGAVIETRFSAECVRWQA